jgi:hypothetical protein
VSIRLLNRHTRNPFRSCISRSTSQSHSLSDSISQRASLFTYHLVRAGYSPAPSSRFTLITAKTLVSSPTDYAISGSGSEHRIVTYAELATDPTQLKSSRACHRHVTYHHFLHQSPNTSKTTHDHYGTIRRDETIYCLTIEYRMYHQRSSNRLSHSGGRTTNRC